ncbi:hypothetical protein FQZ97_1205210 [compost metagenome]
MGFRRHGTGDLGPQALQLVLGDVAAHQFQRTGQHPGVTRLGQAFDDLLLALPVHAEFAQLLLRCLALLTVGGNGEELAHSVGLFFRQRLAHVQPVGAHHRLE